MNAFMKTSDIRQKFIEYFESKGHTHVPSSSLVPYNDQTLLFTNAGMVQFKDVFLGLEKKPFQRAVTAQRCVRAGGKHNDLDTVGRTARHFTFFEMLGNFSFGDYFKEDAIRYAWEFITQVLKLEKDRLYATVYEKDDEAYALWQKISGLPEERIYRIGAKDNFWSMGDTGPCGPCSEIFYDRGEKYRCDAPECGIGKCDCDRYMEIWNLVFMQYDRDEAGQLTPLPRPSIDTGMGLERVASILQGVDSNYDIDIMAQLIHKIESLCGKIYDPGTAGFPFRVIADHSRSCSFLIADGVMPSNEGRGYVLRRILRRAVRFGKLLGLDEPFLYKMVPVVAESLGDFGRELAEQQEIVAKVIKMEEERFQATLQDGLQIAEEIIAAVKQAGNTEIGGQAAFTLYDTYGFPLDLTKDIAEEHGLTVDETGFNQAMAKQREMAKKARKDAATGDTLLAIGQLLGGYPATRFLGYTESETEAKILTILIDGEEANSATAGQEGFLALDQTVFYGESGGQAGDTGCICATGGVMDILDTKKLPNGVILHKFRVANGEFAKNEAVHVAIDREKRAAIAANHSATHLLHRALRRVLGDHVHQAGSAVDAERLRFDFSHFQPLTAEELAEIEADINRQIRANLPISCTEMPLEEAKATGAMAFFGDKYGDIVRVVCMGDYSKELCGGTHCQSTGEIGLAKILSESGIAAGMRRIEMLTGQGALAYYQAQEAALLEMAELLKSNANEAPKKLAKLLQELKEKNKELEQLQAKLAQGAGDDLAGQIRESAGLKRLAALASGVQDIAALRDLADMVRDKYAVDVLVLAANAAEKVVLIAACSEAAQKAGFHAGKLVKEVAAVCGGGGGGRPDMAQAGGKDTAKTAEAVDKAWQLICNQ